MYWIIKKNELSFLDYIYYPFYRNTMATKKDWHQQVENEQCT